VVDKKNEWLEAYRLKKFDIFSLNTNTNLGISLQHATSRDFFAVFSSSVFLI